MKTTFSDAYISGMPAKKRKTLASGNITAMTSKDQDPTKIILNKVLSRTIEQVELKPNASGEELLKTSLEQSELVESFSQEFDSAINERLKTDEDFLNIIKSQSAEKPENDESGEDSARNSKSDLVYNKDRFTFIRKQFK